MKKLISVVVPAYNEQDNVDELAKRLQAVFSVNPDYDFEAIIVENGSLDNTYEKLLAVHHQDSRFKVLQLARNFRMDGGITAGLNSANGDAAVIMTADLQDPPELITEFIKKWEEGYENIYGIVTKRNGTNIIRKLNSQFFYMVANVLTDGKIPSNVSDFRLVDRKVYETINSIHERNRFVRGLFAWVGYKSIGIKHERAERFSGVSGAHTFKVIDLAIKGIFAHSYIPLKIITITGITVSMLSFVLLAWILIKAFVYGVPFAGYAMIMTVMLLLFGILFTMLGVVSEYLGLVYEEVKQRPNYVVSQRKGFDDTENLA
jgi:dolichol-phosphate mannosyltransferase